MPAMTSRLDRLFLLLETGSSPLTRKAAALQLGEVQKLHPHELHNLLSKVRRYLHSNAWDTRIAAGQAVQAIVSNVPVWDPPPIKSEDSKSQSAHSSAQAGRMKLSQFDIHKVIEHGSNLLASEGKEYETEDIPGLDTKEKLAKQRQMLNKRLGMGMAEQPWLDTAYLFSNDDIDSGKPQTIDIQGKSHSDNQGKKRLLSDVYQSEINQLSQDSGSQMLSRGKQKLAKMVSSQGSDDVADGPDGGPSNKKSCVSVHSGGQTAATDGESMEVDVSSKDNLWEEAKEWPFESFSDELIQDLFHLSWEVRHGAATALREIIKLHGKGAGKTANCALEEMEAMNQLWLEDMVLRLVCVLALDKFGDFISDQVIAPIRETCAQALGAAISIMQSDAVIGILSILLQLLFRPEWEARHGGLLGIKYVLAVRKDMKNVIIPLVFDHVCRGLKDDVDDVSAVAASALVPVTNIVVSILPHKVCSVVASLWDALLDLDDLTASTSSILELLASLLSYNIAIVLNDSVPPLCMLVPRLWPFLSHNSSGVRKSVLEALSTLISNKEYHSSESWVSTVLPIALRLLYQRCLIEPLAEIQNLLYEVWKGILQCAPVPSVIDCSFPFLSCWLSLLMQPPNVPIDPASVNSFWLDIPCKPKEKTLVKGRKACDASLGGPQEYFFIGGCESMSDNSKERELCVMRAKLTAAKCLGMLFAVITKPMTPLAEGETPVDVLAKLLMYHLNFKSALQRLAVSQVLSEWAKCDQDNRCPLSIKEHCLQCLNENVYFDEIAYAFTRVQQDCKDFISLLKHYKVPVDPTYISGSVFTFEQIDHLATVVFPAAMSSVKLKPKLIESLDEKRKLLMHNVNQTRHDQMALTIMVQAAIAAALVSMKYLPEKLNPVIRPLMDSIKREENKLLQKSSAFHIVQLMELCLTRANSPNPKIIKNLSTFLCNDTSNSSHASGDVGRYKDSGIISLVVMQKSAEKVALRRCNSSTRKTESADPVPDDGSATEDDSEALTRKRGATLALRQAVSHFGKDLAEKLPRLWELVFDPISQHTVADEPGSSDNCSVSQELLCGLQVLEVIAPSIHPELHSVLESQLPHLCFWLGHPKSIVRHMAARCLGILSCVVTTATMDVILEKLLKRLGATDNDIQRQGVVEGLSCVIDELALNVVPYIVFLIVPLLGRMSDQNEDVRLMATHCFAALVKLMPLEIGIKDPPTLRPELIDRKIQERRFLEQLLNPKKLEPYEVPVKINAELRSYQQEGVNWLAFLNQYKLHGILCDDMGLGKTLQSICILAGDHYLREKQFKETKDADCKPLPSLVVCPPTLTGHWVYEVEKFVSRKYLKPLHYTGPPMERVRLRSIAKNYNLLIASYDIVRNDIDFFGTIHWNYCILDEGHVIKNGKTKLAKAIKQLSASHRVILSGTPIQNNVMELWSLFDFLMPGFLGTEKQFTARYSKPILFSRDAKSSSKEQEAGVLAMESLHRQVLPFLLRRMKEDVLQDLPPKIIQDYYCDLSSLQVQLYEDFAKSRAKQSVEETLSDGESAQGASHVFQALQYLRKVCNHPKLVLSPKHPEYHFILEQLQLQKSNLNDIQHAAKLCALRQLLQDCGIGATSGASSMQNDPAPVVNQHRALIFCQLKGMLDILEKDLFQSLMPSVSYLRLDGSIPPGSRHAVVHRFNNDPSIDVLLLTTQVGGLGLNLTGADTVIFVEHDWNPMKDLQAMDRAHRIGQKKVVNVYRLITRGTLEEKIMGLQKFKLSIANSVINQENSNLQDMGTDQILDLFSLDNKGQRVSASAAEAENSSLNKSRGIKSLLDNLPELWDTDQYDKEYDLDTFLQSLHK